MKNYEKLKQEQEELKGRLHRLIDFMNSEEYFTLPENEKSLLNSQRIGMESYLNALTARIYSSTEKIVLPPSLMSFLMGSLFSPSPNSGPSAVEAIKKETSEQLEAQTSEHIVSVPDNK